MPEIDWEMVKAELDRKRRKARGFYEDLFKPLEKSPRSSNRNQSRQLRKIDKENF